VSHGPLLSQNSGDGPQQPQELTDPLYSVSHVQTLSSARTTFLAPQTSTPPKIRVAVSDGLFSTGNDQNAQGKDPFFDGFSNLLNIFDVERCLDDQSPECASAIESRAVL
jgi:hypothetical protein